MLGTLVVVLRLDHKGVKEAIMTDLQTFIQSTQDSRELKRALAVQNTLAGRPRAEVAAELGVKESFIGMWRWRFKHDGIACLSVGYRGSTGYLTTADKQAVVEWIQHQKAWDIQMLYRHIEAVYGVRYKSQQSYYALLKEARISWKKSQHRHPDADPAKVRAKRDEIKKKRLSRLRPLFSNKPLNSLLMSVISSGAMPVATCGANAMNEPSFPSAIFGPARPITVP